MGEIVIRLCKTWDECLQCEELQKSVWEMPDYRDAVPANFLITALKNGGLLVGAFDGTAMVGFTFGFLGSEKDASGVLHLKHTSHMLAVSADVRVKGLGARLKWFQRAEALKQGLDLMTWTYDPLQSINAHLNLARLGAIARRYYRDAYGEMTDALNVGIASDRFEVEWYLSSPRVQKRLVAPLTSALPNPFAIYQTTRDAQNFPVIVAEKPLQGETLYVEIPSDINAIKAQNLPLAVQWRERTRDTFERAFAADYAAVDLVRSSGAEGSGTVGYVLSRNIPD